MLYIQEIAELRNHLISIGIEKPKKWEPQKSLQIENDWFLGHFTIGQILP